MASTELIQDLTLYSSDDTETLNRIYKVCEEIIIDSLYDLGYSDGEYSNIKPLHFNFCLEEIYLKVFKDNPLILHVIPNTNNEYDSNKILAIYKIYKRLSNRFNQEVGFIRFTYFTGIDKQTFYNWSSKVKVNGFDIVQIIQTDSEQSLSAILNDKSVNALGVIAKLNHYHNWREDNTRTQNINISVHENTADIASRYHARLSDKSISDQE